MPDRGQPTVETVPVTLLTASRPEQMAYLVDTLGYDYDTVAGLYEIERCSAYSQVSRGRRRNEADGCPPLRF